ncbi:MAG: ribosome biogenesis GTPase Der [Bacillota bacterium]|jgi:GTP-binding protein
MKPIVALVGRPNVGKSTLFNRIIGERKAIVEDTPGITRDRLYEDADWGGHDFILIDTGGIDFENIEGQIESRIYQQVLLAIEEADVIVLVTDGMAGLTEEDARAASILKRSQKPIVLAVNKIDNFDNVDYYDFYRLGIGDPIPISSIHGMNTGDLLDAVVQAFPVYERDEDDEDVIKFALIGRPNVGKSSLSNRLLGEERTIVSDIPGTTRDSIDSSFEQDGQKYTMIDTAGVRRQGKIKDTTEKYSIIRTLRSVDRSDVVLMLLDAVDGVTEQDKKIAGYAHNAGKGMLIVVNKWDAIEKDEKTMKKFEEDIREEMAFLSYAPIVYISALTGQRVHRVLQWVRYISEQQNNRVATSRLNEVIGEALRLNPPPTDKGKKCRILYGTQVGVKPPKIALYVNDPELVHFSYERYLINQLRQNFGFEGTPIWLLIRKNNEKE